MPSKPILKESTLYTTATIPLFLGNKKFFTTLTKSIGVTTVTEYEKQSQQQQTASPQLPQQQQPQLPQLPQLPNQANPFQVNIETIFKQ